MEGKTCPDCYGRGTLYRGKEWRTGIAGSYEVAAYDNCTRCDGSGEIEADVFTSELETRVQALETQLKELSGIVASLRSEKEEALARLYK